MKKGSKKVSERNMPKGFRLHYYTLLDLLEGRPRVTICLAVCDGVVARGIAICSLKEFLERGFREEVGREKARRRALKAWNRKSDVEETVRAEAWDAVALTSFRCLGVANYDDQAAFFRWKGRYGVAPTALEEDLMGKEFLRRDRLIKRILNSSPRR